MFQAVFNEKKTRSLFRQLKGALAVGADRRTQTLSSPGGKYEAKLFVRPDLDLWANIETNASPAGVFHFSVGTGEPSWQTALEISVPVTRNAHCYGQLVQHGNEFYLGHRGALGGGKYSVKTGQFRSLIQGFAPDEVVDGKASRSFFILGSGNDPDQAIRNIAEYVHEASRIRDLRRNDIAFQKALYTNGALSKEFLQEKGGGGSYTINRTVVFDRFHSRVLEALSEELKERQLGIANGRIGGGIGPDIYILNSNGEMEVLFEIKVSSDYQSIFTAIGQLFVYSADHKPTLVLVAKGLPAAPEFATAIKKANIKTLKYKLVEGDVQFENLDAVLS